MAEMTLDQQRAVAMAQARLRMQEQESSPQSAATNDIKPPGSVYERAISGVRNFAADKFQENIDIGSGLLRGAGSIGATLAALYDIPSDYFAGKGLTLDSNRQRRAAMDSALQTLFGANPQSGAYQVGKIGGEVAGTAGVGGLLARGAQAIHLPEAVIQSLATSGLASTASNPVANTAARIAGGAITGGAAAGMVDPETAGTGATIGAAIPVVQSAVKGAATVGRQLVGNMAGTGAEPIRVAYESGKTGGRVGQSFLSNMRGSSNIDDVLTDARKNLDAMRVARADQYRANMASVKTDRTVLDMQPIEQSIQDTIQKFTFKGQAKNPKVLQALEGVSDDITAWKQMDPAQFHTPEGLDALKQRIGAALDSLPYEERAARTAVKEVYRSVWGQIQKQAPAYARAMREYEQASGLIDEITRSLSLGERNTADTAMRKLQSVMRNNVNTNYGARTQALRQLEQQGGREIAPALAGQALNDWMPRGIHRATSPLLSLGAATVGGVPAALATSAASSPRIVGETAYLSGRAAPYIEDLLPLLARTSPVLGAQAQ